MQWLWYHVLSKGEELDLLTVDAIESTLLNTSLRQTSVVSSITHRFGINYICNNS